MAHLPDGLLPPILLAGGGAASAAAVLWGMRAVTPDRVPQVAVLSAVFFTAALIHFPAGLGSVHLILNGLMGLVLGPAAAPAILVALVLQAVLFGFGGLLVLGINAANMIFPALTAWLLFKRLCPPHQAARAPLVAGLLAALAVFLTSLLVAACLALAGREFLASAAVVLGTAIPVMVIEGFFTAAAVGVIARTRPQLLGWPS